MKIEWAIEKEKTICSIQCVRMCACIYRQIGRERTRMREEGRSKPIVKWKQCEKRSTKTTFLCIQIHVRASMCIFMWWIQCYYDLYMCVSDKMVKAHVIFRQFLLENLPMSANRTPIHTDKFMYTCIQWTHKREWENAKMEASERARERQKENCLYKIRKLICTITT